MHSYDVDLWYPDTHNVEPDFHMDFRASQPLTDEKVIALALLGCDRAYVLYVVLNVQTSDGSCVSRVLVDINLSDFVL